MTVTPNPAVLRVDETLVLVVTMDADSAADRTVIWKSADARRVTVTETGIITGTAVGPAVVTATSKANPNVVVAVPVTVEPLYTGVRGITVDPAALILTPGKTQTVSANVNADPRISRAVTFASDNADVATATNQGVVTAIAPGSARITARSVADTSAYATVAITVRAAQPPQVSVQSITSRGTGNPVDLTNVYGQIDVTLNVEAGEDRLQRVDLVINNGGRDTVVATQNFSAAQAAALAERNAFAAAGLAPSRGSAAASVAPIVLSVRTDAFDGTTGFVAFRNGPATLKVLAVTAAPGGSTSQQASNSTALQFRNIDGFLVAMRGLSNTGTASAFDVAGRRWVQAGRGLLVTSTPVSYSGRTIAARTVSFPATAPVAGHVSTARGVSTDTLVLPESYVSPSSGPAYIDGELPGIVAVDAEGRGIDLVGTGAGAGILNAQSLYTMGPRLDGARIDNVAPPPASFAIASSQQNRNNWINAAYAFTTGLTGLLPDAGVGYPGANVAPTAASAGVAFLVWGEGIADTVQVTTGVELPASNTNLAYRAYARLADRLGNSRQILLTGNGVHPGSSFGVDITPPVVRYATIVPPGKSLVSTSGDSVFNSAAGSAGPLVYAIEANDDRAGLSDSAVFASLVRRSQPNPAGAFTGTTTCVIGTGTACEPVRFSFESVRPDDFRQFTLPLDGGSGVEGYYTFNGIVRDQAGNASPVRVKRALFDRGTGASAPALTGVGAPGLLRGGQPAAFFAVAADNIELARGGILLEYHNLPGAIMLAFGTPLAGGTTIGTAFDDQLTSPVAGSHAAFTVPQFIRSLETVSDADAPQPYDASVAKPTAVNAWVRDYSPGGVPATLASNVPLLGGTIESPPSNPGFKSADGTPTELRLWRVVGGTPPTPGSAVRFEAVGPSGQTVAPFVRVMLLHLEPSGLTPNANVWRNVAELTAPVGTDNGLRRVWTYDFGSRSAGSYVAVGVSNAGDAIATRLVAF